MELQDFSSIAYLIRHYNLEVLNVFNSEMKLYKDIKRT